MIKREDALINDAIELMITDPIKFRHTYKADDLVESGLTCNDLRNAIKRIYDLNENQLNEMSNANEGIIGKLNKKSTEKRLRKFRKRIDRRKEGIKDYVIYAEGDSWFQFPLFIKDIIDHLNRNKNFIIYSDAYGGDWITNILYEEQYIKGISTYKPDVFLISGGGNDLLGNHRLGLLVDNPSNMSDVFFSEKNENDSIVNGRKYINKEFYSLINLLELQYSIIFRRIYAANSKHLNMITITQGYDYPYPTNRIRFSPLNPVQPLVNTFMETGNWLYTPLKAKRIYDEKAQKDILFTMIHDYNEMLAGFTRKYKNVYHIDCRGLAGNFNDWYDELHLKSRYYRFIAEAYESVIMHKTEDKIIKPLKI